jgi:NADPH:quinone reductase-like Zn-dependent oxidoreductase
MKAAVHDNYGPPEVMRIEDIDAPVPATDEILVRVRATTVNRSDGHRRSASPFVWRLILGIRRPRRRVLGMEFAGVIESVGSAVSEFAPGDDVFGIQWFGANAELMTIRAKRLVVRKPPNVTFEQAAAVPDGFINALNMLKNSGVGPGMRVLVYGASGSIGTAAVQLAKHMGAKVTAVSSTRNVELVRSLGADDVIDYTTGQDFTKGGAVYDVVADCVGKLSYRRARRILKPGGAYVSAENLGTFVLSPFIRLFSGKRVVVPVARSTIDDMLLMARLLESGEYRPVIDRTYPLEEIVEAARYVDTRKKRGSVVLTVS